MSADRPDRDRSQRPVTTVMDGVHSCPFVCFLETQKMFMAVLDVCSGVKMSADRLDRDGSGRPVSIRVRLSVHGGVRCM